MKTNFEPEDIEVFRMLIREELAAMKPQKVEPKFYTREEAAKLLKITLPTLHAWTTKGKIQKSKIGNRVLFADEEITRMVTRSKK